MAVRLELPGEVHVGGFELRAIQRNGPPLLDLLSRLDSAAPGIARFQVLQQYCGSAIGLIDHLDLQRELQVGMGMHGIEPRAILREHSYATGYWHDRPDALRRALRDGIVKRFSFAVRAWRARSGGALHDAKARHVEIVATFEQLARDQQVAAFVGPHLHALLQ